MRSSPRDEVDLIIAARGSRCPCFGNLSRINFDQSDALCRLSDGAGLGKRTLYSDFDESIAWVQRPFILNGINPVAHSGDLLDRLFRITLEAIPEDRRKTPDEYWQAWNAAFPRILGAVYDTLARVLEILPRIERPATLPRMADVALFGIAVEHAAGWPEGSFMEAYRANIAASDESALEGSPVFEVMEKRIDAELGRHGNGSPHDAGGARWRVRPRAAARRQMRPDNHVRQKMYLREDKYVHVWNDQGQAGSCMAEKLALSVFRHSKAHSERRAPRLEVCFRAIRFQQGSHYQNRKGLR